MKQTILKLLLFINSILLIAYMGLTSHADFHLNTRGVIPLFLSSLLLIDVTYVSSLVLCQDLVQVKMRNFFPF